MASQFNGLRMTEGRDDGGLDGMERACGAHNGPAVLIAAPVMPGWSGTQSRRSYRLVLAQEAAVAMVINILIGGLAAWLSYHGRPRISVWGVGGVVADMAPSTFLPGFLMALALPFVIGARVSRGGLGPVAASAPPVWPRSLAHRPLVRAMAFAVAATAAAVLTTALLAWLSGAETITPAALAAIKLVQNALLGLIVGPLVTAHALADRRAASMARA